MKILFVTFSFSFVALIAIFFSNNTYSFTLNNNVEAVFTTDHVAVNVASIACVNIARDNLRLLTLVQESLDKFWGSVPSKGIALSSGRIEDVDQSLRTAALCNNSSSLLSEVNGDSRSNGKYLWMNDHIFYSNDKNWVNSQNMINTKESSDSYGCVLNPVFANPKFYSSILIVCSTNSEMFPAGSGSLAVAVPLIENDSKNIQSGIILINDTVNSSNYNYVRNLSDEDLKAVLGHEIGHALGIGHSPTDASLMYYMLNTNRNALSFDDIDAITYLYPGKFELFGASFCGQTNFYNYSNNKYFNITSFLFGIFSITLFYQFIWSRKIIFLKFLIRKEN
ncbi:MAG: matrixin family metalloprotease [Oligoflexia bacterium]|nr:matrixin family metalloprotease [Oligoflexia bacterium]